MKNTKLAKLLVMRLFVSFFVAFLFAGSAHAQSWQLVWSDEFDGPTLNTSNWNVEVNNFGGYNNELQYYTSRPENVRIENNKLVIEARKESYLGREYTSGRLNSSNKKSWKYGKIEALMKLPYGNGMWPAFWAMGNTGQWPACGEIDIMELVGGNKCGYECGDNKTHGYMWYSDNGDKSAGTMAPPLPSGKYADDYHLFGIEWDATSIKWTIDGNVFHTENITGAAKTEFHQPFYLLLNVAVGGDWPGSPDASTVFPQKMYVEYVRVYQQSTCTVPAQPGLISGNTSVAAGSTQTYSIASVANATSYTWTLPSGWSGTSTSTSITTTSGNAGGTISVKANNACGASVARTVNVSITCLAPAQPGTITGNASVPAGSSQTYSIAAVANATSYTWTLPSGWSGTSSTTSITTTAGTTGGTISVRANNSCGASTARTLNVTITCTVPAQPGVISGSTSVAAASSQTYSIAAVANATSYTWTLPAGWVGTSTSTSISATTGSIGGTISVRANNTCGSSSERTLAVTVTQTPVQTPYGGTAWSIPGTIEAENYDLGGQNIAFNELSATNEGGAYRIDAVDIEAVSGGGYNVGWIMTNEWLEYTVNVISSGNYKIDARVAAIAAGKTFRIEMDGASIGTFTVPNTTGWQIWQTITLNNIPLTAGQKVMRVFATSTDFNLDKVIFSSQSVNVAPSVSITSPSNNASFTLPASISINANATDSDGSISKVEFFRGADKIGEDVTSPYSITWTGMAAGTYSITAKATDDKGATTTSSAILVSVNPGSNQSPYNGIAWSIPGTIEAENYDLGGQGIAFNELTTANQGGAYRAEAVDVESNTDNGGGYNVGYVLTGEWLEYTVNVSATGTYKLDVRVAAITSGKTFHIEMNGVNVSGTITVPNTQGWDSWQTVSINNVSLVAGQQIMRVVFDSFDLNLNYVTFTSTPAIPTASKIAAESVVTTSPNPFVTNTTLSVVVKEAGQVSIKVYDQSGYLVKVIAEKYLNAGTHQFTFDGSGLKADLYLIKCITPDGVSTSRIMKTE